MGMLLRPDVTLQDGHLPAVTVDPSECICSTICQTEHINTSQHLTSTWYFKKCCQFIKIPIFRLFDVHSKKYDKTAEVLYSMVLVNRADITSY